MALISLSDWIDRFGDEPEACAVVDGACVEAESATPSPARSLPRISYRIAVERAFPTTGYGFGPPVLPSGSEIADTRTRLL